MFFYQSKIGLIQELNSKNNMNEGLSFQYIKIVFTLLVKKMICSCLSEQRRRLTISLSQLTIPAHAYVDALKQIL